MFCTHCGTSITNNSFCSNCGKPAYEASFTNPPSDSSSSMNGLSIAGIALGAIGFFIFPVIFATVGIVCAAIAKNRREPLANIALIVSIAGLIGGMIFGAIVAASSML